MNTDIYNPTEYWTPDNIPNGTFSWNNEQEVDANFVWTRLQNMDWHNAVEYFHAIVHFGITQNCGYKSGWEYFQFFLAE